MRRPARTGSAEGGGQGRRGGCALRSDEHDVLIHGAAAKADGVRPRSGSGRRSAAAPVRAAVQRAARRCGNTASAQRTAGPHLRRHACSGARIRVCHRGGNGRRSAAASPGAPRGLAAGRPGGLRVATARTCGRSGPGLLLLQLHEARWRYPHGCRAATACMERRADYDTLAAPQARAALGPHIADSRARAASACVRVLALPERRV